MLIDPDDLDTVQAGRVLDEQTPALSQHGVVGGVPRDSQAFGDAGHGQVLAHDPFQRPPQTATGEPRPRLGRLGGVLAPHVSAPGAPVAANRDQQRRRSPAQRLVRQAPHHGVAGRALAAAASAPLVRFQDPAGQDRLLGLEALTDDVKTELVETAEGGQVRAGEGSVRHVEVFQMRRVGTFIFGRPRPLSGDRRADPNYTLDPEEPLSASSPRTSMRT